MSDSEIYNVYKNGELMGGYPYWGSPMGIFQSIIWAAMEADDHEAAKVVEGDQWRAIRSDLDGGPFSESK